MLRQNAGDFVTTEAGTGFVHIAPGHGADDYDLGMANGIEVPQTVAPDGSYFDHVGLFAGKRVLTPYGKKGDANAAVIEKLKVQLITPVPSTPDEVRARMAAEKALWADVIKAANIRIE